MSPYYYLKNYSINLHEKKKTEDQSRQSYVTQMKP